MGLLPDLPVEEQDPWFADRQAFDLAVRNEIENLLASKVYVDAAITALVNSSPAALDTLNELSAALGNDPNFATTITNALAAKAALSHNHAASEISSGTLAAARLPSATETAIGALEIASAAEAQGFSLNTRIMTPARVASAASSVPVADLLARYSAASRLQSATPAVPDDVANKAYVDALMGDPPLWMKNPNLYILGGETGVANYYTPPNAGSDGGVSASALHFTEVVCDRPVQLNGIRVNRNGADTASSQIQVGVYQNLAELVPGKPTGLPIWSTSVEGNVTGQVSITVPSLQFDQGESFWIAVQWSRATAGELLRMVVTSLATSQKTPWYKTDWNAAAGFQMSNISRQGWWQIAGHTGPLPDITDPSVLSAVGHAQRYSLSMTAL